MPQIEVKHFKVLSLSGVLSPNSIYFVLDQLTGKFKMYITDLSGIPVPILDLTAEGSVISVTGTGVSGTPLNPTVNIATFISTQLGNRVYLSLSDGKLQVNPITSPNNSIEVTETATELQVQLSSIIEAQINSALQPGDNISQLNNDLGYITNTNLTYTVSPVNGIINSDTGLDATIPLGSTVNAGLLAPSDKVKLNNTTNINSGDQFSIVGITGTKSDFDTTLTDGNFLYIGDITQYTDEQAQDSVGAILTDSGTIDFTYNDVIPSITGIVKSNSITSTELSNTINISEFINDSGYISNANLTYSASPTSGTVLSDVGTDAIIPLADVTNSGLFSPSEKANLANQSGINSGDNAPNTNSNAYADSLVTQIFRPAGSWDASGNTFPTTGTGVAGVIRIGDTYNTTIAGTPVGFETLDIGDNFYALIDAPGQTPSNWAKFENNTQQATESFRGTGQIVTQAIIEDDTTTDDSKIVTAKKWWLGFNKALTLAWTWTLKQTFTTAPRFSSTTANTVPYLDVNKDLLSSAVTPTELGYSSGVTSSIQTQINSKELIITASGNVTDFWSGTKTFRNLATDVRDVVLTGFNSAISWARVTVASTIQNAISLLQKQTDYLQSTRVISGTGVTINGGDNTKFDIQVVGEIVDPLTFIPTPINVNLTAQTVTFLASQTESYITINSSGTVVQSLTAPDPTTYDSILGTWVLIHSNLINLNSVNPLPMYSDGTAIQLHQLLEFDGFRKKANSNIVSPGTTGTRISHTGGLVIKNGGGNTTKRPIFSLNSAIDSTLRMRNRNDVEGADTQTLDVTNIDVAGVTTALANNKFGAIKIWKFSSSLVRAQRGQYEYASLAAALSGITNDIYIDSPNGLRNGVAIGWIIFEKGTTWAGGVSGVNYLFRDIQNNQATGTFLPNLQTVYSASGVNITLIKSLSDFPTPVGGNITLVANTAYQINGSVNIGTNTITFNSSNIIYGIDKSSDKLIYTGTSTMLINSNKDCSISNITLTASTAGGSVFGFTGTTNKIEIKENIFGGNISLGTINGGDVLIFRNNYLTLNSAGITVQGTYDKVIIADNIFDNNSSTITCVTIPSGVFGSILISRNEFDIASTQTGLNVNTGITITSGILSSNIFIGVGTKITGFTHTTTNWLFIGNQGIANKRREFFISRNDMAGAALTTPTTSAAVATFLSDTGANFLTLRGGGGQDDGLSFTMQVPSDYFSGGTFDINFTTDTTASNLKLFMAISKITVGTNFGTLGETGLNIVTAGVTQYNRKEVTISPITTTFAAGDVLVVKVWRDPDDASDVFTGNTYISNLQFVYNSI
jgi:hypothetical protein